MSRCSALGHRTRAGASMLVLLGAANAFVPLHDIHVTQSRVVVENRKLVWRVRCFSDDLEKALRAVSSLSEFSLATDRRADSLATAYFNAQVHVVAAGGRLRARLVVSGREMDAVGGDVNWYELQFEMPNNTASLSVRQTMLLEQFPSQQNLVVFLSRRGAKRQMIYFAAGNDKAQTISF